MEIPNAAQELLLDGLPNRGLVRLNVAVQPKTGWVHLYFSEEDATPLVCKGPRTQINVKCQSGRIFVEKCGGATSFEISIVGRG